MNIGNALSNNNVIIIYPNVPNNLISMIRYYRMKNDKIANKISIIEI